MKRITLILAVFANCIATNAQIQKEDKVYDEFNNKEQLIAWPEGMTIAADSLLMQWNAQHYLYPDTDTEKKVSPQYTAKDIQDRLKRLPTVIEMPYNNIVKECIDKYALNLNKSVSYLLGAGNFYIPLFEETLDRMGLPLELKYLPVIESALNPNAVSPSGASGLWQIMLPTAQHYALEINSLVDERRDPEKSTIAAAKYLKDLFAIYDDWNLVIAAYNYGPANVNKAIHRADGKKDYWSIYPYLPKEARGYVPAFIAANYIMNYYCEHNICPMKTRYPMKTDTILINKNLHMHQIQALCDIDVATIKALNPQYSTEVIPGASKPRVLRLPQDKILSFIDHQDSIYNYKAAELLTKRAVVAVDTKEVAKAKDAQRAKYVTVRNGDTLGGIARRNHTTVRTIKRLSGLRSDRLRIGMRLRVK